MRMILVSLALSVLSHPLTAAPPQSLLQAQSKAEAAVSDPFSPAKEVGKKVTVWECTAAGCKAVSRVPYANQHGQFPAVGSVCFAPSAAQYATARAATEPKRVVSRFGGGRERFRERREGPLRRLLQRFRR